VDPAARDLLLVALGGGLAALLKAGSSALKLRRDARREDDASCREALAEALGQVERLLGRDAERRQELDGIHAELRKAADQEAECQRRLKRLEEAAGLPVIESGP
jgi:hypothetical protein